MSTPRQDAAEWISRRRLHGLLLRGARPAAPQGVVRHLTAMQAQEHAYARWSVAQRIRAPTSAAAVDAAFDAGRFLRTHVLRPTWHYVAADDVRWLIRLSGPRVDAANARRYRELGLDPGTLDRSNDLIAEAVEGGHKTRREIAAILDQHGISADGQRLAYELMHAELTAVICSGPMRGSQHTYAAFDERVPAGANVPDDEALGELAWRYFSTRGPATLSDFSWWSGLRAPEARQALTMAAPRLSSVDADGRTYWLVEQNTGRASPGTDLVQCYDEVIISYNQSRDILHSPAGAFPVPRHLDGYVHVLLADGRLLGHWRAIEDPAGVRIETRINAAMDTTAHTALATAIRRYLDFLA